jgi:alpha-mannosidase
VLWGVGDHGGGPSRGDLGDLQTLRGSPSGYDIRHSTPEAYFAALHAQERQLPLHHGDLNAWAVGCYTSQIRIKQTHRLLENELFSAEKMLATAALNGRLAYPHQELAQAQRDLLLAEFHDILPGSSIQPVEENALRLMQHGLEILARLKARAFFALCGGQKKAAEGEIPILIYNPHPYSVSGIFECEFQLPDQNWQDTFSYPTVSQEGRTIPAQAEKEQSNLNLDWRKRVVFAAELAPAQVNRFDCTLQVLPRKPAPQLQPLEGKLTLKTECLEVVINCATGLMDRYRVDGIDYLAENAFQPLVIGDDDDPWGMNVQGFREVVGRFSLMSPAEGTAFSGVRERVLDSVRVIEDGAVRTVVEAVFSYGHSFTCLQYKLPKQGAEIEVQVRVLWNEKSRMLKLALPTPFLDGRYSGQVAFGVAELPADGREVVAQKWVGVWSADGQHALTCVNDGAYGSDFAGGELRLSLLRSPGYAGHPIFDRPVMAQDRFSPRIDQGERCLTFWINGGPARTRREQIDWEALGHNERPYALSFFPSGAGDAPPPAVKLRDPMIQMTAFKQACQSQDYVIRVFNPTGEPRSTVLEVVPLGIRQEIHLSGFEIKTLRVDAVRGTVGEVDLMI